MPVLMIGQSTIRDANALAAYGKAALPTIIEAGGKVLVFEENPENIEGEIGNKRTVVLEWPTREAAMAWYNSPAYQAVLGRRLAAAPGTMILVNTLEG